MWSILAVAVSFLAFWSVSYRKFVPVRMMLFGAILLLHVQLVNWPYEDSIPETDDALRYWQRIQIILGATSGIIAGLYLRITGWRLEKLDLESEEKTDARTIDVWFMILGMAITVPVLMGTRVLSKHFFYTLLERDFLLLVFCCFLAAWVLAFVSITVCRFSNQWLVAAALIIAGLTLQFVFEDTLFHYLEVRKFSSLSRQNFLGFVSRFTLLWWGISWLLSVRKVGLQKTREWLIFQLQIKHFAVASCVAAVFITTTKAKYSDDYLRTIQKEVAALRGYVEIRDSKIVSLHLSSNGLPGSLTQGNPPLNGLEQVTLSGCQLDDELLALVSNRPKLKNLAINYCMTPATGRTVKLDGFDTVEVLTLLETNGLSTQDRNSLLKLPNLRQLTFSNSAMGLAATVNAISSPTLQVLDVRGFRFMADTCYEDLLKMEAPELAEIRIPKGFQIKGFARIPAKFPKLTDLTLECPNLTAADVNELNALPLNRLRLQSVSNGFENIAKLQVTQIEVDGTFGDESLVQLLNNAAISDIEGKVATATIQKNFELIINAHVERGLVCRLGSFIKDADLDIKSELERFPKNMPIETQMRILRQIRPHVSKPQPVLIVGDDFVDLGDIRLSLDQYFQFLQHQLPHLLGEPVRVGSRIVIEPFHNFRKFNASPSVIRDQPLWLNEIEDSELRKVATLLRTDSRIMLVEPKLTLGGWRQLVDWRSDILVTWDHVPEDIAEIAKAAGDKRIHAKIPPRNVTKGDWRRFMKINNLTVTDRSTLDSSVVDQLKKSVKK